MFDELSALVAEAVGLSPTDVHIAVRRPLDHQSNRLYDVRAAGRHLILKEYLKPDEFREAPLREYRALELLAPLDIAPRPILLLPESHPPLGPLVAYEYVDGEMWNRRRPTSADLEALAGVWLRMHTVAVEGLWLSRGQERPLTESWTRLVSRLQAYIDWTDATSREGGEVANLCRTMIERCAVAVGELAAYSPPLCFCRADPRFANVIGRPDGRLALVDWEDSGLRDPARDVADLLTHANQEDLLSARDWHAFLEPYLAVRGTIDPHLSRRLHLYLAVFPIFWLVTLLDQGMRLSGAAQLEGWSVNGLPAEVRLRRYAARALA